MENTPHGRDHCCKIQITPNVYKTKSTRRVGWQWQEVDAEFQKKESNIFAINIFITLKRTIATVLQLTLSNTLLVMA